MFRKCLPVLMAGGVVACAMTRSQDAGEAETRLVGLKKHVLYQCAGVPDRYATVQGLEYATYHSEIMASSGVTLPIIGGGVSTIGSQYCNATFTVQNGAVASLVFSGAAGQFYAPLDQCGYIVERCLQMRAAQR